MYYCGFQGNHYDQILNGYFMLKSSLKNRFLKYRAEFLFLMSSPQRRSPRKVRKVAEQVEEEQEAPEEDVEESQLDNDQSASATKKRGRGRPPGNNEIQ